MVYSRWQSEVPSWQDDARRSSKSLRHLRAMTSSPEAYPVLLAGRMASPDFERTGCVSPVREISDTFDGRATIPNAFRLATPSRSRREQTAVIPAYPPGKDAALGVSLRERLAMKHLYLSPPKVPHYVNDASRGTVNMAVINIDAPLTAPKRGEFCRLAQATSKFGVFPRTFAGVLPWTP